MKRVAVVATVVLAVLTFLIILWRLQGVVFVFVLALAIATALNAPVNWLAQRKWPQGLAVMAVYGGASVGLLGLAALIFTPLVSELDPLLQRLLLQYGLIQSRLLELAGDRTFFLARFPSTDQIATWLAGGQEGDAAANLLFLTQGLGSRLGEIALATVIAVYWAMDGTRFERLWLSVLPLEQRSRARAFLRNLSTHVGAYMRSELAQSLAAGGLLTAAFWLCGVDYPVSLAFLVALAWLIPLIGGGVAVLLAALVGGLAGLWPAVLAVASTVLVLAAMEYYVQPRLYGEDRYWGILAMVLMLALGDAYGLVGLLIAPPVAVALQIIINGLLNRAPSTAAVPATVDLDALRTELATLRAGRLPEGDGQSPVLRGLVARLESLLQEAEEISP